MPSERFPTFAKMWALIVSLCSWINRTLLRATGKRLVIVLSVVVVLGITDYLCVLKWIPRADPEGIYDAKIPYANCLCYDGRAYLMVFSDSFSEGWDEGKPSYGTWHLYEYHPGTEETVTSGTWKRNPDNGLLEFEYKPEKNKTDDDTESDPVIVMKGRSCFGGIKWQDTTSRGTTLTGWFPRLLPFFNLKQMSIKEQEPQD